MRELALHILDIVENSIRAKATRVEIAVDEDIVRDTLAIEIKDNGQGMDAEFLRKATDPFVTTRQTRKVGLGLALLKAAAEACDGKFCINSEVGRGTVVQALFRYSHIDRMPLGNVADTVYTLIVLNPQVDFRYSHTFSGRSWVLDTRDVKERLELDSLAYPEVLGWVRDYLSEGINYIYKGA